MTVYVKPAVRSAWAQNAGSGDLVDPGDSYAAAGFLIGVKPPRQYFNWLANWSANAVRYFSQNGIVDYDPAETYQVGSVVMGPDFLAYQSITANNIGNTPANSPAQWGPLLTATASSGDNSNKIASTAFVNNNFVLKTASIQTLPGVLANSQVPVNVVTQWEGALIIGFAQVNGTLSNGQLTLSNVSQFQGSLAIGWGQITGLKNADELQGYALGPIGGYAGNTIPRYDASGYLYAGYLSQGSINNENPSISQVMVTNGSDNFLRKASVAALRAALGNGQLLSSPGYTILPGGVILQWGYTSQAAGGVSPGVVSVTFPTAFPHAFFGAICSTKRSTAGAAGSNFITSASTTGMVCIFDALDGESGILNGGYWFAVGY